MIGKDTKIPKMVLLAPLASAVLMVIAWVISFVGGSVWWSAAFLTLAIILSFMLVLTTVRAILGSVHMLTEGTKSMLDGDLTKRIDVVGKGEIGEAEKGFNSFADHLWSVISSYYNSTARAVDAAQGLCGAFKEISTGLEQATMQANSVAVASEEMSGTATEIARNCASAAKSSELASDAAINGESVINETVNVMNRINGMVKHSANILEGLGKRSDEIGEIINLINDIADQTNLLALNAAIEAARAGEHGRGFAVVADEVRKLAEKTTAATKNIGDTIKAMQSETKQAVTAMDEGVREVESGAEDARKSGAALKDILNQIRVVSGEIGQIAVASEQQTATIDEIANNIHQVSTAVAQTARTAEQRFPLAAEMLELSAELNKLVRHYKLATMADLKELVTEAVAYYKAHGKEKAFAEISDTKGRFIRKGSAVMVMDLTGTVVAAGADKVTIGMNLVGARDMNGKEFVKECLDALRTKAEGQVEYNVVNPLLKTAEQRTSYFQRVDNYCILVDVRK